MQKAQTNVSFTHAKRTVVSGLIIGSVWALFSSMGWAQTYYVQPGDSLYSIAARYGTSITALQQSNGLKSSTLYPGQALNISPGGSVSGSGSSYTVQSGDSLFLISQRFGISVDALKKANNLSSNYLLTGQRLTIPSSTGSGTSSSSTYRVQSGDSLFLIAQKYGITVDALKQANQLTSTQLWVGQSLKIPSSGGTGTSSSANYTVKSGDTLYLIAKQYGISLNALLSANGMSSNTVLYPGQRLVIPKSTTGTVSSGGNFNLSQSDIDLLARLVSAESSGEPFNGQVAVAATILNRLRDPRYPKSIPGIVYQIDYGRYQYSPVLDGRINLPASASAYKAVQTALSGVDPSNGANGFYNPAKTVNQWVRSNPVTAVIGNHVFFSY